MTISTYHVHNILKAYGKQLSRESRLRCTKGVVKAECPGRAIFSTKTRQKAVIDGLTSHIINRLVKNKSIDKEKGEVTKTLSIKDSKFLKDRLQQEIVNRKVNE